MPTASKPLTEAALLKMPASAYMNADQLAFFRGRLEALRDEMRAFVKGVPRQLILDMDADRVRYPRESVEAAAPPQSLQSCLDEPALDGEANATPRGAGPAGGRTS